MINIKISFQNYITISEKGIQARLPLKIWLSYFRKGESSSTPFKDLRELFQKRGFKPDYFVKFSIVISEMSKTQVPLKIF